LGSIPIGYIFYYFTWNAKRLSRRAGLAAIAEFLVFIVVTLNIETLSCPKAVLPLYVSAVFAVARCPSVCLSVTFVNYMQTAEDIVKLLSQPGSPFMLVFFNPNRQYQIPRKPLQRGN